MWGGGGGEHGGPDEKGSAQCTSSRLLDIMTKPHGKERLGLATPLCTPPLHGLVCAACHTTTSLWDSLFTSYATSATLLLTQPKDCPQLCHLPHLSSCSSCQAACRAAASFAAALRASL